DAVIDAFEPVIEPAQRLVLILVYRAIEIDSGSDDHFLRTPPILPGGKRAGQMKTVVAPASAEVSRNVSFSILRAVFTPKRSVERMQQEIDDQRVSSGFGILQRFAQPGYRHDFFIAHRLSDGVFISDFAMRFFVQAPIVRPVQAVP